MQISQSPDEYFGVDELEYPIDIELQGISEAVQNDVENMLRKAELMGIDLDDPELMGGFIKRIIAYAKKKNRARKRRKRAAKKRGDTEKYAIDTPVGKVGYSQAEGISFMKAMPKGLTDQGLMKKSGIAGIMENPIAVVGIAAGAFLILNTIQSRRSQ